MIVAGERKHAAMREVPAALACFSASIERSTPGPLAVPDAEHAIDRCAGEQADLLAAPHRRRREILVEAGLEMDVVRPSRWPRAPQRVVVHAERRAAIARDEAAGIEACRAVALPLQHRQAHQRLDAGKIDAATAARVLVVQGHCIEQHFSSHPQYSNQGTSRRDGDPMSRGSDYSATTVLRSNPTEAMSTSTSSPGFIQTGGLRKAPLPAELPVQMTSPGTSSVKVEQ